MSEALRYSLLWKYGGAYFDFDIMSLHSVYSVPNALMIESHNHYKRHIANAFLQSEKEHPFYEILLNRYVENYAKANN